MSSHVYFDQVAGIQIPSTEEIREEVVKDYLQAFGKDLSTSSQSPQGQLIDSQTAHIATKNIEILKLSQQFNPLTAEGVWQDALASIYFLKRKEALPTRVECICKGLEGTVIPKGALISFEENTQSITQNSQKVYFASEEELIISSNGEVSGYFQAEQAGPIEVNKNSLQKIVSLVNGWDSVDNPNIGIIGRNEESQQEFERRRYLSVSKNAHGTAASVYASLANLPDVLDVAVLENRTNNNLEDKGVIIEPHSIFISILGGDESLIAKTIYEKLSAGCGTSGNEEIIHIDKEFHNAVYNYKITRPSYLDVFIRVSINLHAETPSTIIEDLQRVIYNNFYALEDSSMLQPVKMASTLYSSRFYQSILQAGVEELLSVKLSLNPNDEFRDDIFIAADKFPQLSLENIFISTIGG